MASSSVFMKMLRSRNPSQRISLGIGDSVLFVIPLSIIFALWEFSSRLNLVSTNLFPPPSQIFAVLAANLLSNPAFMVNIFRSMLNLLGGIIIASIIAIPLAIATGLKSKIDSSMTPLIMILGALPDITLLPILVYWLGPGATAAIMMATIVAFFPIFFTVREGVKNIPQDYFHVATVYRAESFQIYTKLVLPAVFPQLVTGLRLAYEFLWEIVIAIEMIASISGIGSVISVAVENRSMDYAFATIFMIGIIAVIIDRLIFHRLENKIRRWHE